MDILVTVFSDSAAVFFALRLPAVEIARAVPTQTTITRIASAPATRPGLIRRLVWRASHRWENEPKTAVARTTKITGAGIWVDAVVSVSTRTEVSLYSRAASGRIFDCISVDASDRYDEPTGLPARLLVRAISISPVYTASSALTRPSNCTSGSSVRPLDALVTATAASVIACS